MQDLACKIETSKFEAESSRCCEKITYNPDLKYYIRKLLNMSRECIANLSVSSENVSTPNVSNLEIRSSGLVQTSESEASDNICTAVKEGLDSYNFDTQATLKFPVQNREKIFGKDSLMLF